MRNVAWGISGDFNTYLYEYEKLGGNGHNWNSMREFQNCLNECSLSDIGNQGPIFTWQRRNLQERLDRVCANDNWNMVFPNCVAFNLPFFGSDHRPVLLWEGQLAIYPRGERPFRFLASWLTERTFHEVVNGCWSNNVNWMHVMEKFWINASEWHRNVYRVTLK
ncbi:uncharacterized protein LOC133306438 [Gastrolobium bilobum]|uniref:uncharacterized protein LOC133306438 n=1 Tax=Gastrolobium bilobum TaxID=150636 RepID=UPI002AB29F22|nr:uncharacterized protein LOC133306438 [Gastrolobium bilobum]